MSEEPRTLNLVTLAAHFSDEGKAYELVESMRWKDGVVCPHCGVVDEATYLQPKGEGRRTRSGKISKRRVWKCRACRKQFSVAVGTIFERSHVPLHKWLLAVYLMCSSKNGVAAFELHRTLDVSYQTAWFMCHRIREAMTREPLASKFRGIVEVDETYIGGSERNKHRKNKPSHHGKAPVVGEFTTEDKPIKSTLDSKVAVVTLVDRETGEARSQVVPRVTGDNLAAVIRDNMHPVTAVLMTDEAWQYKKVGKEMPSHHSVNHNKGEYVRGHAYTNTVEGFFSQLKRGIDGTYHHVSPQHLDRYLAEFDFRYSTRTMGDDQRTRTVFDQVAGKRLMYRDPTGS
jgi:transposase-like protein